MTFDWEQLRPNWEVSEPHTSLIREIAETFLESGTGLPDRLKRVELGRQRKLLDELVQFGFVTNISNKYYPTFASIYFLPPDKRDYCGESTDTVFKAFQSLYKKQGPQQYAVRQVLDEASVITAGATGEKRILVGMLFVTDFKKYFSNFSHSQPIPVVSASVTENILDYESLQQAWREELEIRPRPQPSPARPRSVPQGKSEEPKTTVPNQASDDPPHDSRELIKRATEAELGKDLGRAEELLRSALGEAARVKDNGALIDAEAALAALLGKEGRFEEAEEHYERSIGLARTSRSDVAEARVLVEFGRLLEGRGKTRRPAQAYLRVREIAKEARPDSILWQFAQEANSRLGHLRHISPEIDDIDPDEERRRDRRGKEIQNRDQGSLEQQAEGQPDESIEVSSICDVPAENDSLGFKPYVEAVSRFLLSPDTRPPLTLSIEGEWGSGKSSFMLQLRNSIVGEHWWRRIKKTWTGAETVNPIDSRAATAPGASKPTRLWQAIRKKKRFAVQFDPWRHDKEDSLWAAFALEFLRQTKGQRFLLRRWWGSAKLFRAHYKWKQGWFEPLRVLAVWLTITILVAGFVEILIQDPWWAAQLVIASLSKPDGSAEKIDVLNILLAVGGNAAFAAIVLSIWLKAKDIVGNPFEINLKKYLRSPDYEGRVAFVEQFHADFRKIVDAYAGQEKVFVFIDDLDRCEVPKAAELMKAINLLIADDRRLVFILGMDRDKVAAGIAVKYDNILPYLTPESLAVGNEPQAKWRAGLNFGQSFLQKFIQLPFRVPEPNPEQYDDFIRTISTPSRSQLATATSSVKEGLETAELPVTSRGTAEARGTAVKAPPPPAPSPAELQVRRERELQFGGDSEKVRAVASMFAKTLGRNPRRLIQFLNLFRLQAYIANEIGLFDPGGRSRPSLTLEQLGKFVAISLRWPALLAQFTEDAKLLERLEGFAIERPLPGEKPMERESRWLNEPQLLALLRFGPEQGGGGFLLSDYTLSSPTIHKLVHICPQRVRLPQTLPVAPPLASAGESAESSS